MINKKDGTLRQPWAILLLYFNRPMKPFYHREQGRDMLLIALVFEVIRVAFTLYKNNLGNINRVSTGITAMILLILVFIVTAYIFPIKLKHIGIRPFSAWNGYEKIFIFIMVPIAFFIFYYFTREKVKLYLQDEERPMVFLTFVFYMCWGFYQEWIYRGLLQTELTRRYGGLTAIVLANIFFTFGPLHLYQLFHGEFILIGVTFVIGLLFGIIYHRSYNLWIVGILHGFGTWFMTGIP